MKQGKKSDKDTPSAMKDLLGGILAAHAKSSVQERMRSLGIPAKEMTEPVQLAVSALLEKLDDVTHELAQAQENFAELERLVDVDCVAPVPNRRAFMRRLAWAVAMHQRYGHACSVLYFDLNDFKMINDRYGHAAGDMAIRHISKVLLESLRGSDFMARLSGDEFAIIMYYASFSSARMRGRKIAERIAQSSFIWDKQPITVTASVGAYEVKKGDDAEAALAGADAEMYRDKKSSKEVV